MKDTRTLGIALTKEACPLCGKLESGDIFMNRILTEHHAKKVEEMHGKVVGFMKEPCTECQDLMKQGFLLIGYVEAKSGDCSPENIYRSGNQWVIRKEAAERMFPGKDLSKGVMFFPVEAAHQMGFPDCNLNA
jgi:hypothetical protein